MANKLHQQGWVFHFVLEAQDGRLLPYLTAEELLDHIIASVEERGLQIGEGFRETTEAEADPAPFPLRGPWGEIEEEPRELASEALTLPAASVMRTAFVLHHTREDEDGYDNDKLIGVYSSQERAERVIESYKGLPGFAEHPEGFSTSAYEIDKDHWTEGFVDLSNS